MQLIDAAGAGSGSRHSHKVVLAALLPRIPGRGGAVACHLVVEGQAEQRGGQVRLVVWVCQSAAGRSDDDAKPGVRPKKAPMFSRQARQKPQCLFWTRQSWTQKNSAASARCN